MSNTQPKQEQTESAVDLARKKVSKCRSWIVGGVGTASASFTLFIIFGALVASGDRSAIFSMAVFVPIFTFGTVVTASNYVSSKEAELDLTLLLHNDQEQK